MLGSMKTYPTMNAQAHEAPPQRRSWPEAYRMFLMNPRELLNVKLLPLMLLGIVPLSLADDVLLPIIGVADDIPTALLVVYVVVRTWHQVRKYR
jgi:hypothetical protein